MVNRCDEPVVLQHDGTGARATVGFHEAPPGESAYDQYLFDRSRFGPGEVGEVYAVSLDRRLPVRQPEGGSRDGEVTIPGEACDALSDGSIGVAVEAAGGEADHPEIRVTVYGPAGYARRIAGAVAAAVTPLRFEITEQHTLGALVRIPHGDFETMPLTRLTSAITTAAPGPLHATLCDERSCRSIDDQDAYEIVSGGGDGKLHSPASSLETLGVGVFLVATATLVVVVVRRLARRYRRRPPPGSPPPPPASV